MPIKFKKETKAKKEYKPFTTRLPKEMLEDQDLKMLIFSAYGNRNSFFIAAQAKLQEMVKKHGVSRASFLIREMIPPVKK